MSTNTNEFVHPSAIKSWDEYSFINNIQTPQEFNEYKSRANEEFNARISIWNGNIAILGVDAIVSAERSDLKTNGGVSLAIRNAAAPNFSEIIKQSAPIQEGHSVRIKSEGLPSKYLILAVGPTMNDRNKLKEVYQSILSNFQETEGEDKIYSIAIPCISTGANGFDHEEAADIALSTVREYFESREERSIQRVIFVTYSPADYDAYNKLLFKHFPIPDYPPVDESIRKINIRLNDLIRKRNYRNKLVNSIPLPKLNERSIHEYTAIPGMYGGFEYTIMPSGDSYELTTESWCRVVGGSGQRHVITPDSTILVAEGLY